MVEQFGVFQLALQILVIGIIDLSFALMCIPNMIAILWLSNHVKKEMKARQWMT